MKVNMTPNPLDVVTIHASQGDTEARQWEFELHNNGELIDTSGITEQLFFKAYKGGTEQLLPENTSTPTTSPFKGDIRYPQGLLNDQEFTYRQSPTESDGLAKITDVKGNTLVWNQLVQNGNFASTSNFIVIGATDFTVSGNVASFSVLANDDRLQQNMLVTKGHKYLISMDVLNSSPNTMRIFWGQPVLVFSPSASWQRVQAIFDTSSLTTSTYALGLRLMGTISSGTRATIQTKNWNCFDLTQMGYDSIVDPSEFTSLFPLSYYSYNQGSLLSFNGNGIKTVGKNLNPWQGVNYSAVADRTIFLKKGDYIFSTDTGESLQNSANIYIAVFTSDGTNVTDGAISSNRFALNSAKTFYYGGASSSQPYPFTLNKDGYVSFGFNNVRPTNIGALQLEFGSTATSYEPYTESVLSFSLPTLRSANAIYDEVTKEENGYKNTTRLRIVDLGTLPWTKMSGQTSDIARYRSNGLIGVVKQGVNSIASNILCDSFTTASANQGWSGIVRDAVTIDDGSYVNIYPTTDYSTAEDFKTAMSGKFLVYELANPTETSFATASLVTENAEIPLSAENDVLVGKCTEELSAQSGFIDAKIKLTDGDGTCYSNKIQLHVERKPS